MAKAATVERVKERVRDALEYSAIVGTVIKHFSRTADGVERSNQSKGNVAADAIAVAINCAHLNIAVLPVRGAGYPDRALKLGDIEFVCAFELKATSAWNDRDGNRRVLTSSTEKIQSAIRQGLLPDPPCHLLGTVLYERGSGMIEGFRLDFIEPDSPVSVRLEASTSHALLAAGKHERAILP